MRPGCRIFPERELVVLIGSGAEGVAGGSFSVEVWWTRQHRNSVEFSLSGWWCARVVVGLLFGYGVLKYVEQAQALSVEQTVRCAVRKFHCRQFGLVVQDPEI